MFANSTTAMLENYIVRHARHYGARHVSLIVLPDEMQKQDLPMSWEDWPRKLGKPWRARLDVGRVLLWWKSIEMLWNQTMASQSENSYNHVVVVRSDIFWLDDLQISLFPDTNAAYSGSFGNLCHWYARPTIADDRVMVMGGAIASQLLGKIYTEYYYNPSKELNEVECSEHFWQTLARLKGIAWNIVRKDWLPYFPIVHMKKPKVDDAFPCLRGINRSTLESPTRECIHPAKVPLAFCEDFELA